jgi:hypothetical protein
MKLTKLALREIIKEEIQRLDEAPDPKQMVVTKPHSNIESKWDGRADRALHDLIGMAQEYIDLGMGDDLDTIIAVIEKKALPEMKRRRKLGQNGTDYLSRRNFSDED